MKMWLRYSIPHDCCWIKNVYFLRKGRGVGWRGRCRQIESLLSRTGTQRRLRSGYARPYREKTTQCRVQSSSVDTRSAWATLHFLHLLLHLIFICNCILCLLLILFNWIFLDLTHMWILFHTYIFHIGLIWFLCPLGQGTSGDEWFSALQHSQQGWQQCHSGHAENHTHGSQVWWQKKILKHSGTER